MMDFQIKGGRGSWIGVRSARICNIEGVYIIGLIHSTSIRIAFLQQNSAPGKMWKVETKSILILKTN